MKKAFQILSLVIASVLVSAESTRAVVPDSSLVFNTSWKGERIELPPAFAPAMKLKGTEEIRFAPGMFDKSSPAFFSFAFVFSVSADQALTAEVIEQEVLAYYRGLAGAVLKGKAVSVDVDKFTFKLAAAKEAVGMPEKIAAAAKAVQYDGELNWTEPFATAKPQVLFFELHSWSDASRNYLFVCASPKPRTDEVWKQLRAVRSGFEVKGGE